jgi:GPH family glycoside/pentoside/hexuronide:cation symporter
VAAFVGQFIVQFSVLRLVSVFGKGNETAGWKWAMAVMSVLAVVLWLTTFATTKERVKPVKEQKNPLKRDMADLFKNKPWVLIGSATLFQLLYLVIRGGSIMYYFKYFVQDQQLMLLGKNFSFTYQSITSAFLLVGTAVTIVGAVMTNFFSKIFGKSRCYFGFFGIASVSTAVFYFLKPQDVVLMFVLQLFTSFAVGPVSVLQWSMYTDVADYSEWKTGRRATALIMAASLFALKLGIALAGSIQAWILAAIGFVANMAQSATCLTGIRMLMSIIPAAAGIIAVVLMVFYPLNNKMMVQIEKDLNLKRQK